MRIGASTLPKYDEGRHVASNVAQTVRQGRDKTFRMDEATLHIYWKKTVRYEATLPSVVINMMHSVSTASKIVPYAVTVCIDVSGMRRSVDSTVVNLLVI